MRKFAKPNRVRLVLIPPGADALTSVWAEAREKGDGVEFRLDCDASDLPITPNWRVVTGDKVFVVQAAEFKGADARLTCVPEGGEK